MGRNRLLERGPITPSFTVGFQELEGHPLCKTKVVNCPRENAVTVLCQISVE